MSESQPYQPEGSEHGAEQKDGVPSSVPAGTEQIDDTDAEIEEMKKKLKDLEERAKLEEEGKGSSGQSNGSDVDARSIFVGNVDYSTKPEELHELFQVCGTINRITILCDKLTGMPKGYAYIEFKDMEAVSNALLLNETTFKGRQIKVAPKRTNIPGIYPSRGRGGMVSKERGRGRGRGFGFYPPYPYPYPPMPYAPYPAPPYYPPGRGRFPNKKAVYGPQ